MMKSARLFAALVGAAMMTGCGMLGFGEESDSLSMSQTAQGSEFSQALYQEYRELEDFERDQSYDWSDASYYEAKAAAVEQGQQVVPTDPANRSIGEQAAMSELQASRSRLLTALEAGGRAEKPEAAAHAQSQYDCWVEEQEEGWQLQNIEYCRNQFELALAELEAQPIPTAAAPVAAPKMVRNFLVFFEFDEANLTPEAEQVLRSAAANITDAWNANEITRIAVTGHTDRAGPPSYNEGLSERRAQSVAQALMELGVPQDAIGMSAEGEADPLVPTNDGVAEPQNRRVQIELR